MTSRDTSNMRINRRVKKYVAITNHEMREIKNGISKTSSRLF